MAVIQTTGKFQFTSVSGNQTANMGSNFTAGNGGVVEFVHYNGGTPGNRISGVTIGGTSATLAVRVVDAANQNTWECWYVPTSAGVAGGTTQIVLTLPAGTGQYITGSAEEWSDLDVLDTNGGNVTGTGSGSSTAPSATTSVSTSQTPVILYGGFVDSAGTNWTSATPPASWTESWEEPSGSTQEAGAGGYFADSGATGTKTGTWATGSSMTWSAAIAAFRVLGGYTMTAAQGSYALTGQAANLLYSPITYTAFQTSFQSNAFQIYAGSLGSPGAYTLAAAQGSYSLSGQAVTLRGGRRISCAQGSYSLSGQAANLLGGKFMVAAQGAYAITGSTAQIDYAVTASQGAYSLVGQAAILRIARQLSSAQGAYALSGQAANLRVGRGIAAAQGSYTLTGQDAALTYSGAGAKVLTAEQGNYSLSGQAAILMAARRLIADTGTYTLSGQAAALLTARLIAAAQGGYSLSGQATNLIAPKKVLGEYGVYGLIGQVAGLTYSAASSDASGGWPIAAMVSEMRRRKAREAERLKALEEEERKREQALTHAKSVDAKQKARAKLEDAKAATERQERLLALLIQEIADAMRQEAEAEEEREILEILAEWM